MTPLETTVALALAVPWAFVVIGALARRVRPPKAPPEPRHGEEYYLGFIVGRHLHARDTPSLVAELGEEGLSLTVERDAGAEKVFAARNLPGARKRGHELESGLIAGGLLKATRARYDVSEERCVERGADACVFLALRG